MKFLHTADWQIGMKAQHVGEAGSRLREERLQAALRVVEVAKKANVDFILIAGDTFEDNGVDRILIQKVADILVGAEVQVFLIPGNHDPLVPGSVWDHPAWRSAENITVLREEKSVEVPGGILYPCPVFEKHSAKDPTRWISKNETHQIQIGVAHGTVEGVHQEEPDYPIPRDAATRAGLDYIALGHWHSITTYESPDGAVRMAYSGTHEATRFGERDSGNVLIVGIQDVGSPPEITPARTGGLEWRVIETDLRQSGDLSQLREKIELITNPDSTLINLQISGLLASDDQSEIARIDEILRSRFLYGGLDTSQLRPSPEDDNWVATLPVGIIRETGIRLRELSDPNFAGQRLQDVSPEVASRALLELYAIVMGGAQ